MITVLSGGVGAARLLQLLIRNLAPSELSAIVNVGDDLVLHGLTICPDLDTITYHLSGQHNEELGWGLNGESWRTMERLSTLGGETWFRLGDLDLATHLYRSQRLLEGATKSRVAHELAQRAGVTIPLLPVSDDPLATVFETDRGRLSFQEYFVRHRHSVPVHSLDFVGAESARPAPGVLESIATAQRIIIAPSNPLISIGPMLAVAGVAGALRDRRDRVVAVSPIINGRALKGPADRLLRELGYEESCVGVADYYGDLIGTLVIDRQDEHRRSEIEARGIKVRVSGTLMSDPAQGAELVEAVLS